MKPCSHPVVLPRHPAIGSRTSLRDQCFLFAFERIVAGVRDQCLFCLCAHCCGASLLALVPLQSVAFPEAVLSVDSLLLCHFQQIVIQLVQVSSPVLLFWARAQSVHYQLV